MAPAGGGRLKKWGDLEPRNRRALVVGVVALGVLLGFVVLKVAGGGGSAGPGTPAASGGSGTTIGAGIPGAPLATTPPSGTGRTPPATVAPRGGKDPFRAPGGLTGATSTTRALGGAGGGGATTSTTVAGPTTAVPTGPQRVQLLDVYPSKGSTYASVKVNQAVYAVPAGASFDTYFKAVDLSAPSGCGDFLFKSSRFHLCKGQQVVEQA